MSNDERTNEELRQAAQDFLRENGYTFRPATLSWQHNGDGVPPKNLRDLICFRLNCSVQRMGVVMSVVAQQAAQEANERSEAWVMGVEALPRSEQPLRRFLRLMQRENTSAMMFEANVLMTKQWLWQVKRHIMRLKVTDHITLVWWSREGSTGKSENIKRLYGPIEHDTRTICVNDLGATFSGPLLAQARVLNFDEFSGADKANAALVKSIITGKPFNERAIYDGGGFYGENRLSCIGSSNHRPPFGFKDETGGRRFWPMHCAAAKPGFGTVRRTQLDLTCVNQVWAAVSYEEESPYSLASRELRDFVEQTQERHMRARTSLRDFVDDVLEPCEGSRIPFPELRREYLHYCRTNGLVPQAGGREQFARYLEDLDVCVVLPKNKYQIDGFAWRADAALSA